MYNFGSPRVGNKRFAEVYNEKVKDSWRVVNHRDIIPTIPRLMGYCHVNQPLFLAAGVPTNSLIFTYTSPYEKETIDHIRQLWAQMFLQMFENQKVEEQNLQDQMQMVEEDKDI
ncbi:uncharacterized protein LOC131620269 isoform X2 [Vicia villosa]|uniref:uncharacterized protein LOC131620269 isoform X2 n=1 Tax=Vicia villosa TaxID=3911 RepID=UPI00273B9BFD|nr:uncharacterized protein LOC131620269 isoform X2 [Vicia villosa]XP_058747258.1 uncharacterized protein LOC131620269 isoform X2 [Vicia villosa]